MVMTLSKWLFVALRTSILRGGRWLSRNAEKWHDFNTYLPLSSPTPVPNTYHEHSNRLGASSDAFWYPSYTLVVHPRRLIIILVIWVSSPIIPVTTSTKHAGTRRINKIWSKAVKHFVIAPYHIIPGLRWCATSMVGRLLSLSSLT